MVDFLCAICSIILLFGYLWSTFQVVLETWNESRGMAVLGILCILIVLGIVGYCASVLVF